MLNISGPRGWSQMPQLNKNMCYFSAPSLVGSALRNQQHSIIRKPVNLAPSTPSFLPRGGGSLQIGDVSPALPQHWGMSTVVARCVSDGIWIDDIILPNIAGHFWTLTCQTILEQFVFRVSVQHQNLPARVTRANSLHILGSWHDSCPKNSHFSMAVSWLPMQSPVL